jgi:hypothetical protein
MSVTTALSAFANRGARRAQALQFLLYSVLCTVLVTLLSAWIVEQVRLAEAQTAAQGYSYYKYWPDVPPVPWSVLGMADVFCVFLLGIAVFLVAPAAVAATVASERRAGTLDQLRTTPLRPLALLAGLVVGAPARIYYLCAGPLALHVVCGLTGVISFEAMAASTIVLAVGAVVSSLLAATIALAPRQDSGGAFLALGVAALLGTAAFIAMLLATESGSVHWAFLHPAGALNASMLSHDGLWRRIFTSDWALHKYQEPEFSAPLGFTPFTSVAYMLALGALLARAACRKLAAPHAPLLSKPLAVIGFALIAAAIWVPLPTATLSRSDACILPLAFALLLVPVLAVAGLFATPSAEAWALRVRSGVRASPWRDDASPHATVWAMLAVYLAIAVVRLWSRGFPMRMGEGDTLSLVWFIQGVATLPVFMLFASTRYATSGARWAFGAAIAAHCVFQMIGIILVHERRFSTSSPADTVWKLAAIAAFVVPALVWWRQRVLLRDTRTRAQAT